MFELKQIDIFKNTIVHILLPILWGIPVENAQLMVTMRLSMRLFTVQVLNVLIQLDEPLRRS